jgi:quinol monooxygenase YgiN
MGDPATRIYGTARFRVPTPNAERAIEAIERFVTHVRTEPGTELYVSLRDRADPTRFTHFMMFRDAAAEGAHGSSEQVREFADVLYPLCDGPVEFERFEVIAAAVG